MYSKKTRRITQRHTLILLSDGSMRMLSVWLVFKYNFKTQETSSLKLVKWVSNLEHIHEWEINYYPTLASVSTVKVD